MVDEKYLVGTVDNMYALHLNAQTKWLNTKPSTVYSVHIINHISIFIGQMLVGILMSAWSNYILNRIHFIEI